MKREPQESSRITLKLVKEPWVSSHLSIFPTKKIPENFVRSAINNHTIVLANNTHHYIVPGNFAYYMRQDQQAKYRWFPPQGLRDMLDGTTSIFFDKDDIIPRPEYVGWIDYAHEDGFVYSGTYQGILTSSQKYQVNLSDALVEFRDHSHPICAENCSNLDDEATSQMNRICLRAEFITQIAQMHSNFSMREINTYLKTSEVECKNIFGESNYLMELNDEIKFPCTVRLHEDSARLFAPSVTA